MICSDSLIDSGHRPHNAQRQLWRHRGEDVGNSAMSFDAVARFELPQFTQSHLDYDRSRHFAHADALYSDTYDGFVIRATTPEHELDTLVERYHLDPSPEAQVRRRSYLQSCMRPDERIYGGELPEHRMLAAINRERLSVGSDRVAEVRDILRANRVTPPMVEKQLEDFGLLSAPDYRTALFDLGTVRNVTGTILQLRYGPLMTQASALQFVDFFRDLGLRQHNLLEEPAPVMVPNPNAQMAGGGMFAGGALTSLAALMGTLAGGPPIVVLGGVLMAFGGAMAADPGLVAEPPQRSLLELQWAQHWASDKFLLDQAFAGELRQSMDGVTMTVPITGTAAGPAPRRTVFQGTWTPNQHAA